MLLFVLRNMNNDISSSSNSSIIRTINHGKNHIVNTDS